MIPGLTPIVKSPAPCDPVQQPLLGPLEIDTIPQTHPLNRPRSRHSERQGDYYWWARASAWVFVAIHRLHACSNSDGWDVGPKC
ncbi:hypothetical protein ALUC_21061S [Aspergillus luchuensis]|nr:hypothetical protein ALUC_21061S [Aspergillus luchuensis]